MLETQGGGGNVEIPIPVVGSVVAVIAALVALLKRALGKADRTHRPPPLDSDKNLRDLFLDFREEQRLHNRTSDNRLEDIELDIQRIGQRARALDNRLGALEANRPGAHGD